MKPKKPYIIVPYHDPDLVQAERSGGTYGLEFALDTLCRCGHSRREHYAATGALGSFGGSACGECWRCGSFHPDDLPTAA